VTSVIAPVALAVAMATAGFASTYSGLVMTMTNGGRRRTTGCRPAASCSGTTNRRPPCSVCRTRPRVPVGRPVSRCGHRHRARRGSGLPVRLVRPRPAIVGPLPDVVGPGWDGQRPFADGDLTCAHFAPNDSGALATHTTAGNAIGPTTVDDWPLSDATGFALADTGQGLGSRTWVSIPTTVWYRFTYHVAADAPAGASVGVALTWEADSL